MSAPGVQQGGCERAGAEGAPPSFRILQFIHTLQQQGPFIHNRASITMGSGGRGGGRGWGGYLRNQEEDARQLGPAHIQSARRGGRRKTASVSNPASWNEGGMATLSCLDQTAPQVGTGGVGGVYLVKIVGWRRSQHTTTAGATNGHLVYKSHHKRH